MAVRVDQPSVPRSPLLVLRRSREPHAARNQLPVDIEATGSLKVRHQHEQVTESRPTCHRYESRTQGDATRSSPDGALRERSPATAGEDVAACRALVVRVLGLHRLTAGVTRQSLRLHDRLAALGCGSCLHPDTLAPPTDVTREAGDDRRRHAGAPSASTRCASDGARRKRPAGSRPGARSPSARRDRSPGSGTPSRHQRAVPRNRAAQPTGVPQNEPSGPPVAGRTRDPGGSFEASGVVPDEGGSMGSQRRAELPSVPLPAADLEGVSRSLEGDQRRAVAELLRDPAEEIR
jgi:hypothetical protein